MTIEVSSEDTPNLQQQSKIQAPIIKEWATATSPTPSKNGEQPTTNASNRQSTNHTPLSTAATGTSGHLVAGTGVEGPPSNVPSNDRRPSGDNFGAESDIPSANCKGGTGPRYRSAGDENMGGNLEADGPAGAHEHDQLAGIGRTNGANLPLTPILSILPVPAHQPASPICPDGVAKYDNKQAKPWEAAEATSQEHQS